MYLLITIPSAVEFSSSVVRWGDIKIPFELVDEVALVDAAYLSRNLLDAQKAGCEELTSRFHSESYQILTGRESSLGLEETRKVRSREINRVGEVGHGNAPFKVGVHELNHRTDPHLVDYVLWYF